MDLQAVVALGSWWTACRFRRKHRLNDLAEQIEPAADWDDLALPEDVLQTLREIAAQVRERIQTYEDWELASQGERGVGVVFSGPHGTGKLLAAEVMAAELRLDLYRIDLSAVVSKYIGETEKNLRRLFDAAESGGAVLYFDEADALFGRRTEVGDAHDRYANAGGHLLARIEAYRGLVILAISESESIDENLLRRLDHAVHLSVDR